MSTKIYYLTEETLTDALTPATDGKPSAMAASIKKSVYHLFEYDSATGNSKEMANFKLPGAGTPGVPSYNSNAITTWAGVSIPHYFVSEVKRSGVAEQILLFAVADINATDEFLWKHYKYNVNDLTEPVEITNLQQYDLGDVYNNQLRYQLAYDINGICYAYDTQKTRLITFTLNDKYCFEIPFQLTTQPVSRLYSVGYNGTLYYVSSANKICRAFVNDITQIKDLGVVVQSTESVKLLVANDGAAEAAMGADGKTVIDYSGTKYAPIELENDHKYYIRATSYKGNTTDIGPFTVPDWIDDISAFTAYYDGAYKVYFLAEKADATTGQLTIFSVTINLDDYDSISTKEAVTQVKFNVRSRHPVNNTIGRKVIQPHITVWKQPYYSDTDTIKIKYVLEIPFAPAGTKANINFKVTFADDGQNATPYEFNILGATPMDTQQEYIFENFDRTVGVYDIKTTVTVVPAP